MADPTPAMGKPTIASIFAKMEGEAEADASIGAAQRRAEAKAARLLAARECPADLIEWGRAHGIPTFAEFTWQAGFLAGMRAAAMDDPADRALP